MVEGTQWDSNRLPWVIGQFAVLLKCEIVVIASECPAAVKFSELSTLAPL